MGGEISALLTLIFLLSPVNLLAQSDVKVVFNSADKSLTFQKGGTVPEGATVYALNEGQSEPGWYEQSANITKVVFDPSFDAVRPISCSKWFYSFESLTELQGLEYLHTDEVEYMDEMFESCTELTELNLSSFNTSKVIDMSYMFDSCEKLLSLDVRNFNTSNVKNMYMMFGHLSVLTALDLTHFNTSNVENMGRMFYKSESLKELDLTNFDTSKTNPDDYGMVSMFEYCKNLETIYVGDKFVITGEDDWMFGDCEKLVGAVGYDENRTGSDMANNQTGYLKKYNKYGEHKSEKVELYGKKAHYQRNHTYEWATICLPFAFSTNDNAAYRFYALKGVEGNSLSTTMLSGTIAAGTPVFVRGANTAGNKIEIVGVDDVLVNEAQTQSTTTANLVGTFADKTNLPNDNYIILKDNFWLASDLINNRPGSSVNINALRAYITPAVAGAMGANVLTITVDDEGGVTGINGVEAAENEGTEMYDLQGRRLNSLQRGLNIVRVGGKTKKVMVN